MIRWPLVCCSFLFLLPACGGVDESRLREAAAPKQHLSQRVLKIFEQKCTACHGPQLKQPEGRFGYVLDLDRMARNPELVIPGSAEESELWILVQRGEMPPADSSDGPLTEVDKDTIREWISAGAIID